MSSSNPPLRLAIIDNDSAFLQVLNNRLDAAEWEVRTFPGSVPADELVAMKLNALLVDLTVLGPDAWAFLERVSGLLPGLGVVVCTNDSTVAQRTRGLRLGADSWLCKPAHPEEVMATIEAVARRRRRSASPTPDTGPAIYGELEIRADQFQVFVSGRGADLTRREFELLTALAAANRTVLEREDIYRRVWGYEMAHGDRSVDVFIRKLRAKLAKLSPGWDYIHTHHGIGYRFDAEPQDPADLASPAGKIAPIPAPSGDSAPAG